MILPFQRWNCRAVEPSSGRVAIAFMLALLLAAGAAAGSWPTKGRDTRRTGQADVRGPRSAAHVLSVTLPDEVSVNMPATVAADAFDVARAGGTGEERLKWKFEPVNEAEWWKPTVWTSTLSVGSDGTIYGAGTEVTAAAGSAVLFWQLQVGGLIEWAHPVLGPQGILYAPTRDAAPGPSSRSSPAPAPPSTSRLRSTRSWTRGRGGASGSSRSCSAAQLLSCSAPAYCPLSTAYWLPAFTILSTTFGSSGSSPDRTRRGVSSRHPGSMAKARAKRGSASSTRFMVTRETACQ